MVPIVFNSHKNFDDESLRDHLMKLCNDHHEAKRALVFAFLVYDFEDNTVSQILENHHYWSALDKISGQFLSVFYINSRISYFTKRQREIQLERRAGTDFASRRGLNQMLVPINISDSVLEKSNDYFKKEFAFEENLQHPFILFFQVDGELIIDYFVVSLKQDRLEEAFLELKRQITNAVAALKRITPENYNNHKEIFEQVKLSVQGANMHHYIKTKIIPKLNIKTLLSFIRVLSGS